MHCRRTKKLVRRNDACRNFAKKNAENSTRLDCKAVDVRILNWRSTEKKKEKKEKRETKGGKRSAVLSSPTKISCSPFLFVQRSRWRALLTQWMVTSAIGNEPEKIFRHPVGGSVLWQRWSIRLGQYHRIKYLGDFSLSFISTASIDFQVCTCTLVRKSPDTWQN